jgi:hypothetical protein
MRIEREFWAYLAGKLGEDSARKLRHLFVRYEKGIGVSEQYARLLEFKVAMYMQFYFQAMRNSQPVGFPSDRDFKPIKSEMDAEIGRLQQLFISDIIQNFQAIREYSFEQGVLLRDAGIKSPGVCNALALDWLRRKNWNALGLGKVKKSYDRDAQGKRNIIVKAASLQNVSKRPDRLDEMEEALVNARPPKNQPVGAATPNKGFMQLQQLRQESVSVDQGEERGYSFDRLLKRPDLQRFPRCIYLDFTRLLRGALAGHAAALFQGAQGEEFRFFDPNHGEYRVAPTRVAWFVAEWFELYQPLEMKFEVIFFV